MIPAFDCAIEHQFSISERMTILQRNRLNPKIISDFMVYKETLANTRCSLRGKLNIMNDIDILSIDEHVDTVLDEWT